jgi:hypothetical protein
MGYTSVHYPQICKIDGDINGTLGLDTRILNEYDSASDLPIAYWYKKLDKIFPGSKFVYTIRSTEGWIKSSRNHFKSARLNFAANTMLSDIFQSSRFHEEWWVEGYRKHSEDVAEYFKNRQDDLLTLDIIGGDKPQKLSDFLGVDCIFETFPHTNRSRYA